MRTNVGFLELLRLVSSTGISTNDLVLKEEDGALVLYSGDGTTLLYVHYLGDTIESENTALRRNAVGPLVPLGGMFIQIPLMIVNTIQYITIADTYPTYTQVNTDNSILEFSKLRQGMGTNIRGAFFSQWQGTTGSDYWRKLTATPVGGGSPITLVEETFTATTGQKPCFQDDFSSNLSSLDDNTDYFLHMLGAEEAGTLIALNGEVQIYNSLLES